MRSLAIQSMVVAMMLAMGMELAPRDLRAGLARRGAVALAIAVNVVLFPVLAFALARLVGLGHGATMGLVVCAAAPAGPVGALFVRNARGDLGLAIALQALLAAIGLVSAPAAVELLDPRRGGPSIFGGMALALLFFQVTPLVVGMGLRGAAPGVAARLAAPTRALANVLLLGIIVGLLVTRGALLAEAGLNLHLASVGLVAAPLVVAAGGDGARVTVAMVTAVRNLSIALLLSVAFFDDPAVDAAILVWGLYMMVVPGLVAAWIGRRRAGAAG